MTLIQVENARKLYLGVLLVGEDRKDKIGAMIGGSEK